MIEHKVVITGVDPELDDDILKEELESRNNLKLTNISRFFHKETKTKIWKVGVVLENEETLKRVLKDGVFLGYTRHKCILPFGRSIDGNAKSTEQTIGQCFKCQKWNPGQVV